MKHKIKYFILIFALCCSFCFFAQFNKAEAKKYKIVHNSITSYHQEIKNGKLGKKVYHKDPANMKKGTVSSFYKIKKEGKSYYYKCKKCGKKAWYSSKKYK